MGIVPIEKACLKSHTFVIMEDTMKALILGIVILFAMAYSVLPKPAGLGWGGDVLIFLRGALPVIAAFIGIIAVFIGIADIKDMAEVKKEEAEGEKLERITKKDD
jgi:hypothetical protein